MQTFSIRSLRRKKQSRSSSGVTQGARVVSESRGKHLLLLIWCH